MGRATEVETSIDTSSWVTEARWEVERSARGRNGRAPGC